jgi:hypothetical protein
MQGIDQGTLQLRTKPTSLTCSYYSRCQPL